MNSNVINQNCLISSNAINRMFFKLSTYECINVCERHLRSGGLPPENALKLLSLGRQKMPFCVVGLHVSIIDLHSSRESMTLPSNLFCTNMEDAKP